MTNGLNIFMDNLNYLFMTLVLSGSFISSTIWNTFVAPPNAQKAEKKAKTKDPGFVVDPSKMFI